MIAHSIYADCSCFGPVDNIIEIAELLVAKGADFDAEDEVCLCLVIVISFSYITLGWPHST
jgi:hypothetical protein